jgi:hypothetical protein
MQKSSVNIKKYTAALILLISLISSSISSGSFQEIQPSQIE